MLLFLRFAVQSAAQKEERRIRILRFKKTQIPMELQSMNKNSTELRITMQDFDVTGIF